MSQIKKMSAKDVTQYNTNGFSLSDEKFYLIGGMFNDEQNSAVDPTPFKIATDAIEKLARTAVGMPWIPEGDDPKSHVRPSEFATVQEIIDYQKNFAGGEIVGYYSNYDSKNAYAIIEVFPEFVGHAQKILDFLEELQDTPKEQWAEKIKASGLKPFLSPMIGNQTFNDKKEIDGGEVLHLHSVDSPGYPVEIARFQGSCTAGLKQCMAELRPLAASGKLTFLRTNPKKSGAVFNSDNDDGDSVMEPTPATNEPKPEENSGSGDTQQILQKIDEVKSEVIKKTDVLKEAVVEVAVGAQGVDENKIKEMLGDKPDNEEPKGAMGDDDPKKKEIPAMGAAGRQVLETVDAIKTELYDIKEELAARKKLDEEKAQKEFDGIRASHALTIVKGKIALHEIEPKNAEEEYRKILDLKDSRNPETPADLKLLAELYKKTSPQIEEIPYGAAGEDVLVSGQPKGNLRELMEESD